VDRDYDAKVGNPPWYVLPDAKRERRLKAVWFINDELISEMEKAGLPGKAILADVVAFAEQYKVK